MTTILSFDDTGAATLEGGLTVNGDAVLGDTQVDSLSVNGGLLVGNGGTLTLDTNGHIFPTHTYHAVDTFGSTSTDDLVSIVGGMPGDTIQLRPANGARTVVFKNVTSSSNMVIGGDFTGDSEDDLITFTCKSSSPNTWICQAQRNNGT